jgi:uncharacterized protein YecT (DUF1311 family)
MRLAIGAALIGAAFVALLCGFAVDARAQAPKPSDKQVAAIRACAEKYKEDLDKVERQCLFKLVGEPCISKTRGSDHDTADCYNAETAIWDNLLNENFKKLVATLDNDQTEKARAMQRAWIAYRDTTCNFYYDKIQGTMANMMISACTARETARRAVLLAFFSTL